MIANQNDIFSPREYSALHIELERGTEREERERKCGSPDLVLACVWPYVSPAECGKQTCSCTEGRRSSPRFSRAGTWCVPLGKSSVCNPGRSRGRSTVGRKHLEFQVAGLQQRERGSGPKGQQLNGSKWALCPGCYEEVSVQSAPLFATVKVGTATHIRTHANAWTHTVGAFGFTQLAEFCSWALCDRRNIAQI